MSRILLFLCLAVAIPAWASDAATTNRATELKASSSYDSATVSRLASGAAVTVIGRSSGWTQVQAGTATGWVRAFHLRIASTVTESSEGSAFGGMFSSLFGGQRRQASQKTATVGIRGLSEEEMKNAKPNPAEYAKMKRYAASKADAESFSKRSRLTPTTVAFVDSNGKPISGGSK